MPYRRTVFVAGELYHLYNRGNNYKEIFRHREDFPRFLRLVRIHLVASGDASLLAYCLMPNHYHLLVRLHMDNLSAAMQAMTLAYAKSFNYRYGRVGRLFQAPFRAILVGNQEYLAVLVAYLHRNPVEAGLVRTPEEWPFSSFQDHVGIRRGTLVDLPRLDRLLIDHAAELAWTFGDRERKMLGNMTAE
jgi:putative transposase